jgi:hypothetical protein
LFFYRDPEEAKEQEEEAAAAPDFAAITDYQGADQWGAEQWTSDVAPPVAPTGADWGAAPGNLLIEFPHLWYETCLDDNILFRRELRHFTLH